MQRHSPRPRRSSSVSLHPRDIVAFAVVVLFTAGPATPQALAPGKPCPKEPVVARPLPPGTAVIPGAPEFRLVVKFRDEIQARTSNGVLISISGADLSEPAAVIAAFDLTFSPLIRLPESKLIDLQQRAAARSGVAQPDLAGILEVHVPDAGPAELEAVGEALQRMQEVEVAYIETLGVPPPGDIPPPTPNLVPMQAYRGPNPGMNVDYAWSLGYRGSGIRLSDCEYAWYYGHEDLVDKNFHPEPGQTIRGDLRGTSVYDHGTAVLGETSGVVNNYGVSGMVPDADVYTYPELTEEEDFRRLTAITHAIANSSAGDVVLLEMQTAVGGPAELECAIWKVVKSGTDAGVIVVAAAGNGAQDLDSKPYGDYMGRGDSEAIIVGAGTADFNHDRDPDSTYGSRVNVQGWGEDVFTLGYGPLIYGGDVNQRYTQFFGNTSGAAPFVAAAAVILEQAAISLTGDPLSPADLRNLLMRTGIPQGTGGHIGPFVDLRSALDGLPPEIRVTLGPSGPVVADGDEYDFGVRYTNALPVSQGFTICNDGTLELEIENPSSLVSGAGFSQIGTPSASVAPGSCTSFSVRLNAVPGTLTGTVTILNTDPNEDPYDIELKAEVIQSPLIRISTTPGGTPVPSGAIYDFGDRYVSDLPVSQLFHLCNDGTGSLVIANPTTLVSGTGFQQIGSAPATPLPPSSCTTFQVRFNAAPGNYTGAVTIQNNFPSENPYVLNLEGTALASAPEIRVTVAPSGTPIPDDIGLYDFGARNLSSLPVSQLFNLCNDGTANLVINNPGSMVSGTGFSQVGTPATPVAPGVCTSFQVRFDVATPGPYSGAVTIQNNDADENPYNFDVKGEATN